MSRPSASLSTVKGFSLTFDDLAAFTNHVLYASPSTPARNGPRVSENKRSGHTHTASELISAEHNPPREREQRHRYSSSSTISTSSSRSSYGPTSPMNSRSSYAPSSHSRSSSYASTSPRFIDHLPRRLTERERAELANYTAPEMDIADMTGIYGDTNFEPLR